MYFKVTTADFRTVKHAAGLDLMEKAEKVVIL